MFLYQFEWILAFALAYVYFTLGKYEARQGDKKDHAWLWAGISFALSAAAIHFFDASYNSLLALQGLYYVAIAVVPTLWEMRR